VWMGERKGVSKIVRETKRLFPYVLSKDIFCAPSSTSEAV
jgi:hypothetical protein